MSVRDDLQRILRKLDAEEVRRHEALRTGIYMVAAKLLRSSIRMVPVDTGRLRATAYVTLPTMGNHIKCRLGYGTNYAVYVHERTNAHHRPPTRSHYLSIPLQKARATFVSDVARYARRALESNSFIGGAEFPETPTDGGPRPRRKRNVKAARRAAKRGRK